jgi:hypothetical protein
MQAHVEGALDAAKNPFDKIQMRLPRGVHIETRLLNGVSDVRASERQVLQCTGIAAALSRVIKERAFISGELAANVDGSGTRMALNHAGSLKKINSILPLREDHA